MSDATLTRLQKLSKAALLEKLNELEEQRRLVVALIRSKRSDRRKGDARASH